MPTGHNDNEEHQDVLRKSNVPEHPQRFPSVLNTSESMVAANGRTSPVTKTGRLSTSQPSSSVTNGASTKGAGGRISDALASLGGRTRTLSTISNSRISSSTRGRKTEESGENSSFGIDPDPFASHYNGSSSSTPHGLNESHAKSSTSANGLNGKRRRGSLLVAASDALGFGRGLSASIGKRMSKRSSTDQPVLAAPQSQQKFGLPWRGKPKMKGQWALQPQASSNIIPDVIEISAAAGGVSIRDSEEESERRERERLREAAAESIGISPLMREDSSSRLTDNDSQNLDDESFAIVGSGENMRDSFEDSVAESVRIMDRSRTSINGTMKPNGFSSGLQLQILQTKEARHHRSSSVSATMSPSSPISVSRSISTVGGQFGTSPGFDGRVTKSSNGSTSETQPYPPDFPCSRGALDSFVKNSSTLLKHFPPSPLLKRGFSRQWRTRLIVMTCPLHSSFTTPNGHRPFTPIAQQPLVCHLHLFKSSAAEERELERLEINEDSVVCVAEEEIAGRKSVVKVGGVDVGGRKKDMNVEENGRTMWFLSIVDSSESQNWITLLKSAVLEQRAERAGIGMSTFPSTSSGPKGDMDVMLSLRAQDAATSVRARSRVSELNAQSRSSSSNAIQDLAKRRTVDGASPAPTLRSHAGDARPASPSAKMMTLKSLFSVPGRARSPSRATVRTEDSVDATPDSASFTTRGNSLLHMLHSTDVPSSDPSAVDSADSPVPHVAIQQPSPAIPGRILSAAPIMSSVDMSLEKAASYPPEREMPDWYTLQSRPHHRGDSSSSVNVGPSLLPPPRKRPWTSSGVPPARQEQPMDQGSHPRRSFQDSISIAGGRLSIDNDRTRPHSPADSLGTATGAFGTPESRTRRASVSSSVSSFASSPADRDQLHGRSNSGSQRRVRIGMLPKMLAPPAGPPPSIPVSQPEPINSTTSLPTDRTSHAFVGDRPPSRTSVHSATAPEARHGAVTSIGRRLSSSSAFSSSSLGTSTSKLNTLLAARQLPASTHPKRASMPPPRPAPTFALPPTPGDNSSGRSSPMKSFRESFSQRSLRFSLSPPPTKSLPSRPGEPDVSRGHRRSSSNGSIGSKSSLQNSVNPISVGPRAPPPTGPLPPTPWDQPLLPRNTSLRERLRMKSAPSSPPSALRGASSPPPSFPGSAPLVTVSSVSSLKEAQYPIPIGEPITTIPHDLNFLNMSPTEMSPTGANDELNFLNLSSPLTATSNIPIPPTNSHGAMTLNDADDLPSNSEIITALPAPPRRSRIMSTYNKDKERNPAPFTNPRTSAVVDDSPSDHVSPPFIDAFTS